MTNLEKNSISDAIIPPFSNIRTGWDAEEPPDLCYENKGMMASKIEFFARMVTR